MRRDLKANFKKIMALTLALAMTLPTNGGVYASAEEAELFADEIAINGDDALAAAVTFYDSNFKDYLLYKDIVQLEGAGITQADLNKITDLSICYTAGNEAANDKLSACHDFSDIEKLTNLKNLTIDLDSSNKSSYISQIAFPASEKLETVSICNTKMDDCNISLPSVQKFEYKNNYLTPASSSETITINDTAGKLSEVNIQKSKLKELILNNTGSKRNLTLNAEDCKELEKIEFKENGYTLLGDVNLKGCEKLKGIGSLSTYDWSVDASFNKGLVIFNITGCNDFAANGNVVLNYNYTSGQILCVYAYGANNMNAGHILSVTQTGTNLTKVNLFCDNDSYLHQTYRDNTQYVVHPGADEPNIAVFPFGNKFRSERNTTKATVYERWVDRNEVVVFKDQNISADTNLCYYNELEMGGQYAMRSVEYTGEKYFVSDDPSIAKIEGDTLMAVKPGRTSIKVYRSRSGSEGNYTYSNLIGQQDILIRDKVSNVILTSTNSTEDADGSQEKPLIVERGVGRLSLTAKFEYEGSNVPVEGELVKWLIADGDNDSIMENKTATEAGVSVVSNSFQGTGANKTNTRVFSFSGSKTKFKVIAQALNDRTADDDKQDGIYVEVIEPKYHAPSSGDDKPEPVVTTDEDGTVKETVTVTDAKTGTTTVEEKKTSPDGTIKETKTETRKDGSMTEKATETKPDGTVTESAKEKKTDGTVTEKATETKPDGTVTETAKVEAANGTVTESEKVTEPDGAVKETETVTKADGSKSVEKTEISSDGKEEKTVAVEYNKDGTAAKAEAKVTKEVENKKMTVSVADIKEMTASTGASAKNTEITLTAKAADGKEKYSVSVAPKNLTQSKLVVYALDKKGNLVVVDTKKNTAKISNGSLSLNIASNGEFQLLSASEAKKADKAILKTVEPAKKVASVAEGKQVSFGLSKKCNKKNISKISYKADNKNVTVDKKGNIKAKSSGTTTVTAIITLKNGKKKKVKMKINVA